MKWIQVFGLFFSFITIIQSLPQGMTSYNMFLSKEYQSTQSSQSSTEKFVTADSLFRIGPEQFPVVFPQSTSDNSFLNIPLISVKRNPEGKLDATVKMSDNTKRNDVMKTISSGTGNIVFPDKDTSEQFTQKPSNSAPRCEKGGDFFCEKVQNYPTEQVLRSIQQESNKLEAAFGEDFLPEPLEISQRIDPGEESLCHSSERLIFPQAGLTKDNSWSFIINHENYTQGVRIEECVSPGKPCQMTESFPNGYTTECKQKYIFRQLLGYTPNGKVVKELYRLPSCCKCIIKQL